MVSKRDITRQSKDEKVGEKLTEKYCPFKEFADGEDLSESEGNVEKPAETSNKNGDKPRLSPAEWYDLKPGEELLIKRKDIRCLSNKDSTHSLKERMLERNINAPRIIPIRVRNPELPKLTQEEEDALDYIGNFKEIWEKQTRKKYFPY